MSVSAVISAIAFAIHDPRPGAGQLIPLAERFNDYTDDSRLRGWQEALNGAKENPLLGWGQEHMKLVSLRACPEPKCDIWFDRAHNLVLDWLVSAGLLGVLAYFWLLWATREAIREAYEGGEKAWLYGLLTAYLVSNMFMFDTLNTYLLLVAVMAIAKPLEVRRKKQFEFARPRTQLEYRLGF